MPRSSKRRPASGVPAALNDISNQVCGPKDAKLGATSSTDRIKTFFRRIPASQDASSKKEENPPPTKDAYSNSVPVSPPPAPTAADGLGEKSRQRKPPSKQGGYNRKLVTSTSQQEETKRKAYMAAMRTHFKQVDEYELQIESESSDDESSFQSSFQMHVAPPDAFKADQGPSSSIRKQRKNLLASEEAEGSVANEERVLFGDEALPQTPTQEGKSAPFHAKHSVHPLMALEKDELTPLPAHLHVSVEPSDTEGTSRSECQDSLGRARSEVEDEEFQDLEEKSMVNKLAPTGPRGEGLELVSATSAAGSAMKKAPAYGLSRRSSICFSDSKAGREPTFNAAARGSNAGLVLTSRSKRTPARKSLLSRISVRLSDALHRLGMAGTVPQTQGEGPLQDETDLQSDPVDNTESKPVHPSSPAAQGRRGPMLTAKDFSPIAESPDLPLAEATPPRARIIPETPSPVIVPGSRPPTQQCDSPAVASISAALKERLQLDGSPAARPRDLSPPDKALEQLNPIQDLLQVCNQSTDERSIPSMEALLGQHVDLGQVRKIGEGTFGEAFKGGDVVFKIVPLEGQTLVNGEPQKRADEILGEVAIALTLSQLRSTPGSNSGNVTSGFVETYGVGICRGHYAPPLLTEWHAWDELNESENEPVDCFPGDQLYVVFVVADGGADLERFEVRNFTEAKTILLQCAMILAVAEEACEFEHRDLHWGNILIKRQPGKTTSCKLRGVDVRVDTDGLLVTLIDFTLSRLQTLTGSVAFCDLEADPELFKGPKGDCQADTYRRMRKATKGEWQKHVPATNTLWMHYLADLLLLRKQVSLTAAQKRELRAFRSRATTYKKCADLIVDNFFTGFWHIGSE